MESCQHDEMRQKARPIAILLSWFYKDDVNNVSSDLEGSMWVNNSVQWIHCES